MTTKTYDGQTARFIASVATCMPPLSGDVMQGWIDNPQGLRKFLSVLNPSAEAKSVDAGTFRLTIDYSQSLEQMIATGNYDWFNELIYTTKLFPIEGNGLVEFEARHFHFDRNISSEDAVVDINEAGWEPAKIEHLCSHGATFPEEQRKFPIVGLGSVAEVDGRRRVPYLSRRDSDRRLRILSWWSDGWNSGCRFLAVRKVSVS